MEDKIILIVGCVVALLLFVLAIFFECTPWGRNIWDSYVEKRESVVEKNNEKKQVEEIARSIRGSYEADVYIYEKYKDSMKDSERLWAKEAKDRANYIAKSYNEYILQNMQVWEDEMPKDIVFELDIIE